MALDLDLLALEEEAKRGRLTFENFDECDKNFRIHDFDEGYLVFDAKLGGSRGSILPEGYCIYYGFNRKKKATYFVNVINLLKAEKSKDWVNVDSYTQARENDGIEIKRVSDKIEKIDIIIDLGRKLTREECKSVKYKDTARFSDAEWEVIRKYALPVKRAKTLTNLTKEVEQYTYRIINQLAEYFDINYRKLPSVRINPKVKDPKYLIKKNEIVLRSMLPEKIYHEAGHYLKNCNSPKSPKKHNMLERFFRESLEEAICFYCSMIGNEEYSLAKGLKGVYLPEELKLEQKERKLVEKIMKLNIDYETAKDISEDRLRGEFIIGLHDYVEDKKNLTRLSHHLGYVLGNELWKRKNKSIVRRLIKSEETDYVDLFFSTKRFIEGLDKVRRDIRRGCKRENKLITKK